MRKSHPIPDKAPVPTGDHTGDAATAAAVAWLFAHDEKWLDETGSTAPDGRAA